jgi:threonine synthase
MSEVDYTCTECGGNLQVTYNYGQIQKDWKKHDLVQNNDYSIWRYEPLLPVNDLSRKPPVTIGWTPLYRAEKLGEKYGVNNLYVKDDGRNPSASSKDRAGAVAVVRALEQGEETIACASTGNAASSLSNLTAPLGIKTIIFVPQSAPPAKITQLLVFGAVVIAVEGTYDQAYDLCLDATRRFGWYNRNTGYNPFTREGKKTVSYEICEQLGWEPPDKVFVPVGDGNMISGVWKGFVDLFNIGFIKRLPRIVACQAAKSDAIKRAFESDGVIRPVSGDTIADSISVSLPVAVEDEQIVKAIPELARQTGVFGEPAGVTPFAAFKKAAQSLNLVKEKDVTVLLVSGSGLKDIDTARKSVAEPIRIRPGMEELQRIVSEGRV